MNLDLRRLQPRQPEPGARERTLARLEQYRQASANLERVCKDLGVPVPVLVC